MQKIVAYYRVSTRKQGQSGLGLEAQQLAVEQFAKHSDGKVIASYKEVESGKRKDRPQLAEAVAHARNAGARLVIAKLDRLARNVSFLSALMDAGVDFVACDNPHANRLTIHILAAVAEDEARRISERTKSALAAAKRRGVQLGSAREGHWEGREEARLAGLKNGRKASIAIRREKAREAVGFLTARIQERRQKGESFASIAGHLNDQGYTTSRGKAWTPMAVLRASKLGCDTL
ncbi:recombinase family protein [Planctomicrobium sp. SH661]|uniref:recombinase family protein n=1 Tax=Planctomicrobium sp. SH661 TaxID=3448124 RepID=UPI003F5BF173